ncbi:hypothetical protein FPV67DRAFT_1447890 [Lyophyllum atratum]|nr:hypothetical protein FPV67DRAFT_1447890 [Lyophyllum atratum]
MAATAHAQIQVYASLPRILALGADLNLETENWHWVLCLTLPLETLDVLEFSPRPYKWIRYAIGIVIGAEGDLSSSSDMLNIVNYDAGLPTESTTLYYCTSDEEKRRMFPVACKMSCTSTTSSVATSRRTRFRFSTADRDGNRCVLTEVDESICDAVHLLAHNKGDTQRRQYISTYTECRSRDPAGDDIIRNIDSTRNGLFLNKLIHVNMGKHVAFLPTPNFAMDTPDVDPTAPPGQKRCTAHLFEPSKPSLLGGMGPPPSGSPLRISDSPDWPPAILFDAVYASAVLHHFGTQALKDKVTTTWTDTFYPGAVMDRAHVELKLITDAQDVISERSQKQAEERQARYDSRAVPDTFDMLLALPYILVPRNELQVMLREANEKAAAAERRRVQEKVDIWNRRVIAS